MTSPFCFRAVGFTSRMLDSTFVRRITPQTGTEKRHRGSIQNGEKLLSRPSFCCFPLALILFHLLSCGQADVTALETWVQKGMELFLGSLEHVEAALEQQKTAPVEDGDTDNGITAGNVSHRASPVKSETSLDVVGAIAPAGATSETAVQQGSGMPITDDAFERITVSGTSLASKPDGVSNPMQQLRAGGKCGGGHDSGSAPLPSGATSSPTPRGVVASAAAAHGSGHRSLPAILLLRSKPKKTKTVAEERGQGWDAAKSPGNKDVSPGARRTAKKRDLEKAERKNTTTKLTSSQKPGSGGREEGGGPRWGKRATMRQPNDRAKGAATQAGKKEESRGGEGPEVSGGLWERLRQGKESIAEKNARGNGSAAKRSATPDAERKGRKGAARESADALKATVPKKERGGGRDGDSGSASKRWGAPSASRDERKGAARVSTVDALKGKTLKRDSSIKSDKSPAEVEI